MAENSDDLLASAPLVALDAVDDVERARILREVAKADADTRERFEAELRHTRAAVVRLSDTTATTPPAGLRASILDRLDEPAPQTPASKFDDDRAVRSPEPRRRRLVMAAAAAAVVLGVGGGLVGYSLGDRSSPPSSSHVEDIFAASDVRTVTGTLAGGKASVTYSPSTGEGVLVMNDVPRPTAGTLYQLWLVGPGGPTLGSTMTDDDVKPSTIAVLPDLKGATSIAFTVGDAATPEKMISDPVAELPLS